MLYMKTFYLICTLLCTHLCSAQVKDFDVIKIGLPAAISYYDNQFSGMFIQNEKLFLMSESRLQDLRDPKIYVLKMADINRKMLDTSYKMHFETYPIKNLELLREKMETLGDDYEGLEAMYIDGDNVYLTVETATPSKNCYLLRGNLYNNAVFLDYTFLLPMPKPTTAKGGHIYNAGFESLTMIDLSLIGFFEYNSFEGNNNGAIAITPQSYTTALYQKANMQPLPFRITDITKTGKNSFTAINYFFKGDGPDTIYRVPQTDEKNDKLIRDAKGYKSYCRLIKMKYKNYKFTWEPFWEFPVEYMAYNWECIAEHKGGYFILNDKYTPSKPYSSVLLYLLPKK
jgi:hypothetical protein